MEVPLRVLFLLAVYVHIQGFDCIPQFNAYTLKTMSVCHSGVNETHRQIIQGDISSSLNSYYMCVKKHWRSCIRSQNVSIHVVGCEA